MTRHKARPDKIPSRHKIRMKTTVRCLCGPGKVWSPSRSQAKKLFRRIDRMAHNDEPVWFYTCEYGGVHWTRMHPSRWPKGSAQQAEEELARERHARGH